MQVKAADKVANHPANRAGRRSRPCIGRHDRACCHEQHAPRLRPGGELCLATTATAPPITSCPSPARSGGHFLQQIDGPKTNTIVKNTTPTSKEMSKRSACGQSTTAALFTSRCGRMILRTSQL